MSNWYPKITYLLFFLLIRLRKAKEEEINKNDIINATSSQLEYIEKTIYFSFYEELIYFAEKKLLRKQ